MTPTERQIYDRLKHGQTKNWRDLRIDPMWGQNNVAVHVCAVRKRLKDGEFIICRRTPRGPSYQLIRMFAES